jgi:radical SAM protein with 4Fe4S-binding SPASM domain
LHGLSSVHATGKPSLHAVALELTRYCNQTCGYCYNAFRGEKHAKSQLPDRWPARLRRLLDAFDIGQVTLTGGEPFAYRGIFKLLETLRAAGVPMRMISNGGLMTDAIAARLAPFAPQFVQLNGPDRALHEEHVGEGHFDKTIDGITALHRHGVNMVGCIVVTRKNATRVGETLALWRSLGVRQIALSRFSPAGYAVAQVAELLPSREQLVTAFEQALPFAREHGMLIHCTMPIPPCAIEVERYAPIGFGGCAIGTSMQEFAIGPDGRVRNCTLHRRAIADAGDIADEATDLRALVAHDDVRAYRATVPEFCRGCEHEQSCNGGCGAASEWVLGGRERFPDPLVAQYIDPAFAHRLAQARSGKRKLQLTLASTP